MRTVCCTAVCACSPRPGASWIWRAPVFPMQRLFAGLTLKTASTILASTVEKTSSPRVRTSVRSCVLPILPSSLLFWHCCSASCAHVVLERRKALCVYLRVQLLLPDLTLCGGPTLPCASRQSATLLTGRTSSGCK